MRFMTIVKGPENAGVPPQKLFEEKDGPFTEAKEVIGGFAIYELPSKAEVPKTATRGEASLVAPVLLAVADCGA